MLKKEYDAIIKNLLEKCFEIEFSDIPPENEINYEFSEKFKNNMDKHINRIGKPYFKLINTTAKRIAVVAACVVLIVASLLSVSAVREKLVEFFYQVFDTYTSAVIDEDENSEIIEVYYTISNIPDGFSNVLTDAHGNILSVIWENSNKEPILLAQRLAKDSVMLDSEDSTVEEKTVNETPCLFIEQGLEYIYYWEFDGYSFTLNYPISLGESYAEQVIGNLVEYKSE